MAWPAGHQINAASVTTSDAIASVTGVETLGAAGTRDYLFWRSNDGTNRLMFSESSDHVSWSAGLPIHPDSAAHPFDSTTNGPAACVFNNNVYLFWKSLSGPNIMYTSGHQYPWPPSQQLNKRPDTHQSDMTSAALAACVFKGKLYLFWKSSDPSNRILYTSSNDGATWPPGQQLNARPETTAAGIAACVLGENLFLFWLDDGSGRIIWTSSGDGVAWPEGQQLLPQNTSGEAPTACECSSGSNPGLLLFWSNGQGSPTIRYATSRDGVAWSSDSAINGYDSTPSSPSALPVGGSVELFWASGSGQIYQSVSADFSQPSDFSLSISGPLHLPSTPTPGGIIYDLKTAVVSGASAPIALSVSGLPSGVTYLFQEPIPTISGNIAQFELIAAANLPSSTSEITITGVCGEFTHSIGVTLDVVAAPPAVVPVVTPLNKSIVNGEVIFQFNPAAGTNDTVEGAQITVPQNPAPGAPVPSSVVLVHDGRTLPAFSTGKTTFFDGTVYGSEWTASLNGTWDPNDVPDTIQLIVSILK